LILGPGYSRLVETIDIQEGVIVMRKIAKDLSVLLLDRLEDKVRKNPYGFSEESMIRDISYDIENQKRFKISDFDTLIIHYNKKELSLYKEGLVDPGEAQKEALLLDLGTKVLKEAKRIRREKTRSEKTKMDTNLLTHSPFFVGGSRKRIKKAQQDRYIQLDKKGFRRMSYENQSGKLLTTNDAKTLLGLFALWSDQGFGDWVTFTEFQLLRKLNMDTGGRQYEMLRDSLNKLRETSLVLHEAYDKEKGTRFVTERFQLIIADRFISDVTDTGYTISRQFEIQFSPYIHKSIDEGYSTLISLAILNELKREASQSIYLLLSGLQGMDNNSEYIKDEGFFEVPLSVLYDSMFLESENYRSKDTVEKGCEELKLAEVIDDYQFVKEGRSFTKVIIESSELLNEVLTKQNLNNINGEREPIQ